MSLNPITHSELASVPLDRKDESGEIGSGELVNPIAYTDELSSSFLGVDITKKSITKRPSFVYQLSFATVTNQCFTLTV